MKIKALVIILTCLVTTISWSDDKLAKDPLRSVQWDDMYAAFLQGRPAVFDPRVKVIAPEFAEDPMNVPIKVDASALSNVKQIVIFADFNPIPLIARYYPLQADPILSFRFKIQQASPVRAAVLTSDGIWRVGGVWVNSAGGGCTAASTGRLTGDWADYLGDTYGNRWRDEQSTRIRLKIHHPMDTGLVDGIPAFFIEELTFKNAINEQLAIIELYEPINENPALSFNFKGQDLNSTVYMTGSDNNGNLFNAEFVK